MFCIKIKVGAWRALMAQGARFALSRRSDIALAALIIASPSSALSWRWCELVPYRRRDDGATGGHGALIISSPSHRALVALPLRPWPFLSALANFRSLHLVVRVPSLGASPYRE
ncbi:hypothetical protein Bbelb_158910 [Branchiostoma belcheri]|nr:hypothetical protein Bbelb_158910 [Branchiostoma belcheri]